MQFFYAFFIGNGVLNPFTTPRSVLAINKIWVSAEGK